MSRSYITMLVLSLFVSIAVCSEDIDDFAQDWLYEGSCESDYNYDLVVNYLDIPYLTEETVMADIYCSVSAAGGGVGSYGDPYTIAEAANNVSSGQSVGIIGGTYVLSADLVIDTDSTWIPVDGDVVIDGNSSSFTTRIENCEVVFGATDGEYEVTFTNSDNGCQVFASSADTKAVFHYCKFNNNSVYGDCGCVGYDGAGFDLQINAYNCQASYNGLDGFSLSSSTSLGSTAGYSYFYAKDCKMHGNGPTITNSQGATAHKDFQVIKCVNCDITGNGGPGMEIVGGACGILEECEIYANTVQYNTYEVQCGGDSTLIICNCDISGLGTHKGIGNTGGTLLMSDCKITGSSISNYGVESSSAAILTDIRGCIFTGFTNANKYAVSCAYDIPFTVRNCTFYNNSRHLSLYTNRGIVLNNIFMGASEFGISTVTGRQNYTKANSGYNNFYNNASDIYASKDILQPTDISEDPDFVDPTGGDFRAQSAKILRGGKKDIIGRPAFVGAVGPDVTLPSNSRMLNMSITEVGR